MELAHQLKKDMLRRDEEIEVLQKEQDKMVQKLEQDKEIRVTMYSIYLATRLYLYIYVG